MPKPLRAGKRIVLSPSDFTAFQGLCSTAALKILALKDRVRAEIAAAHAPQQRELKRLAVKYRASGLRADGTYQLDEATHALIEIPR